MSFKDDFVWGAAAASYQIEGAAFEDGKGLSVWDTFSHKEGKIKNNDNGDIACDHYHRYKEDVSLMKEMGLKAYRFSISWPRIIPNGTGTINEAGLNYYSSLVDELLSAGIEPYVTLFHWELPQNIYERGGWLNRNISDWFAEYVRIVVDKLSDRVRYWMTINEPQCHILLGHVSGNHAPGDNVSTREALLMLHNIHLAHGKAVSMIRSHSKSECKIGYAPNPYPAVPFSNSEEDINTAKNMVYSGTVRGLWSNALWLDPVILGKYPDDALEYFKNDLPDELLQESDLNIICQPIDFLGINQYEGAVVKHDEKEGYIIVNRKAGYDKTAMKWIVIPEILYYMPKFLYERYKLPIIITENGLSLSDWVCLDGKVHDPNRIDYMHRYLRALKRASSEGVDIQGYFYWSLMDNFEWAEGYNERFGLIHVDLETQKRTLKDSAYWYREIIKTNGIML